MVRWGPHLTGGPQFRTRPRGSPTQTHHIWRAQQTLSTSLAKRRSDGWGMRVQLPAAPGRVLPTVPEARAEVEGAGGGSTAHFITRARHLTTALTLAAVLNAHAEPTGWRSASSVGRIHHAMAGNSQHVPMVTKPSLTRATRGTAEYPGRVALAKSAGRSVPPVPHMEELDRWTGQGVAVKDGKVIAASESSRDLAYQLRKLGSRASGAAAEYVRPDRDEAYVVGVG